MIPKSLRPIAPLLVILVTGQVGIAGQDKDQTSPAVPAQDRQVHVSQSSQSQPDGNTAISRPDHRIRVHLGTLSIGAGYAYSSRVAFLPLYCPYWGYSPFWGDPFWNPDFYPHPVYGAGLGPGYGKGQVKFQV